MTLVRHQTCREADGLGPGRRMPSPEEVGQEGRERRHSETEGESKGKEGNRD